jgi:ribonucleoside-diphosphate reductase alpha chain
MEKIEVKKRDGSKEPFNPEKINEVVSWACEGFSDVSPTDIILHSKIKIFNGITTQQIHEILIKSAADLITEEVPDYQYVAAKLVTFNLRKKVWGSHKPISLFKLISRLVEKGIYDENILKFYTKEEIDYFDNKIKHDRDYLFAYAGIQQLIDKYLIKNRSTGEVYETPQFAYMIIGMIMFAKYKENRDKHIVKFYNHVSTFKLSLPTPILAGVRTMIRQFASCCLIDIDDTLDSIFTSNTSVGKYTAQRSGIGLNFGRIRPIGSTIRNGEVIHTGVIPYLKMFEACVKSTQQSGLRGGGGTVHFPWFHYEIEDVLVLKNNSGTDENRVRKLDYSIQLNRLFYERVLENKEITLFSPHEANGLYEAFTYNDKFEELYLKYEKDESLVFRKKIKARDLLNSIVKERLETGRIYIMHIDHCNLNSSWNVPVYMSNLCQEILQPTKPQQSLDNSDLNAEIGICILSALNLLEIKNDTELESVCDTTVRFLDELIDYQNYPVFAAENFTKNRRSLGIGITNLAAWFAKNKVKYHDKEALSLIDEKMEKIQFFLLKASNALAQEKGACAKFNETSYSRGVLPIDRYNKNIDLLVSRKLSCDWEGLRESIAKSGLRHSTLTAVMPCESSSLVQNSTNGIEPPRTALSIKRSAVNSLKQLIPNVKNKEHYTFAFDIPDNKCLINVSAVIQKWVDMSISLNFYYDYSKFKNSQIPLSLLAQEQIYAYKMGIKTIYYTNSNDGDKQRDISEEKGCASGACSL